jgi:hypothetical protein
MNDNGNDAEASQRAKARRPSQPPPDRYTLPNSYPVPSRAHSSNCLCFCFDRLKRKRLDLDFSALLGTCGLEALDADTRAQVSRMTLDIKVGKLEFRRTLDSVDAAARRHRVAEGKHRTARHQLSMKQRKLALVMGRLLDSTRRTGL